MGQISSQRNFEHRPEDVKMEESDQKPSDERRLLFEDGSDASKKE
jgi:hypothetical protein